MADVRGQRTEGRGRMTEVRRQRAEVRCRVSGVRCQKTDAGVSEQMAEGMELGALGRNCTLHDSNDPNHLNPLEMTEDG